MASQELELAREAARVGGEILSRHFRQGVTIRSKATANLVCDADTESERAIVEVIRNAFPDHAILAEEAHSDRADAEHLWVIDPLDGTNNFAHNIPHFAVSIAYCRRGETQCGVIYNPLRDDWYWSELGRGSFHNDRRVQVDAHTQLNEVLVAVGFYYDRGAMMEATLLAIRDLFRQNIHGIRRFGAAALDLCQVGGGSIGAYFEYTLSPWDFAAGQLFVEEAGGIVTTCRGEPPPLARTSILATNGRLHETVLKIVRSHLPEGMG